MLSIAKPPWKKQQEAHLQQLELFNPTRWPKKPYCTDDLETGLRIRSLASALKKPYIQANPPHLRVWSIYDVDRAGAGIAWEDAMLPPPSWASVNRENGHAHLVWGLTAPVLVDSPDMRQAPLRYLCAVEAAFRAKLEADQGFAGLITKNPSHPLWKTLRGPRMDYDLGELSEYVDLDRFKLKPGTKIEQVGLGRNVWLFDTLRHWAYIAVRRHRDIRNFIVWQAEAYDRALTYNGDLATPLDPRECYHIAKSVSKWVWARDAEARTKFIERQAWKGSKGGKASGVARLAAGEDKRASARLMHVQGINAKQIAGELGASLASVYRWISDSHEA